MYNSKNVNEIKLHTIIKQSILKSSKHNPFQSNLIFNITFLKQIFKFFNQTIVIAQKAFEMIPTTTLYGM